MGSSARVSRQVSCTFWCYNTCLFLNVLLSQMKVRDQRKKKGVNPQNAKSIIHVPCTRTLGAQGADRHSPRECAPGAHGALTRSCTCTRQARQLWQR